MALLDTGLVFTGTWDLWGQWQNVLLCRWSRARCAS